MGLPLSSETLALQDEVRRHFDRRIPPRMRADAALSTSVYARREVMDFWQRVLHEKGWGAPSWPEKYGGCNWTPAQHFVFAQEKARAFAPPFLSLSVVMCGAVIIAFGAADQKTRFLPAMLSGAEYWCQGYSEPNAGSDLAAISTFADENGDDLVCNGSKIWTSHAHEADWMYCLVRTTRGSTAQNGITFLLVDMRSPGIEVRPIVFLTGEHIQNEVIFHDVVVPKANAVGEIGKGWAVAKYLMEFERGIQPRSPEYAARLDHLLAYISGRPEYFGDGVERDPCLAKRIAEIQVALVSLEATELAQLNASAGANSPGMFSSVLKVLGTELSQRISELALELAGYHAFPYQPLLTVPGGNTPRACRNSVVAGIPALSAASTLRYFNDRAGSIYAGSNEIQKNILAKRQLRL